MSQRTITLTTGWLHLPIRRDAPGRYVRFGDEPAIYLMELELLDPMMRLAYQGMEEAS